jgi:hypothetical protein
MTVGIARKLAIPCSLDFSSGPVIPCRWLWNRSFRSPVFVPTHFGSPGQAPTHIFASDFPSSQARAESPKRLPSSKRLNTPRYGLFKTVLFLPAHESLDFRFFCTGY